MENILQKSKALEDYLVRIRRHLHKYPELSMEEKETIKFVTRELQGMGIPYEIVPDGGIIGTIEGKKKGKTLILRADLDALPMQEAEVNLHTKKAVVSQVDGVAHTCGHDAHTAILLGVAKLLIAHRDSLSGNVLLVFEQGEEVGGGILNMMNRLLELGADGVWGLHLKNDLPSGKISVEAGPRMSSPLPFEVTITGKGGHGSRPDLAHSPVSCFVDLYTKITMLRMQALDPLQPLTFSVGKIRAGDASNIIPEKLTFAGTFRFLHLEQGKAVEKKFKQLLEEVCTSHGCSYSFLKEPKAKELFVYNDETCSQIASQAVAKSLGKNALAQLPAWMASEPFALYQAFFPGVFAFLGIQNEAKGTGADHHNPHFDVDEAVLPLGVAVTAQYTLDFLNYTSPLHFRRKYRAIEDLLP